MSITDFQDSFSLCPIYLVGGVAGQGQLGISEVLRPLASGGVGSASGLTAGTSTASGSATTSSDALGGYAYDNFGIFSVLPGGSLMDIENAKYPLANQTYASNASITQPLKISFEMLVPASEDIPFSLKRSIMTALKSVLDQHTSLGGYYTAYTPAYIYNNLLLTSLIDGSEDERGGQPQTRWIWDFEQPLLTVQQGQAAQSQAAYRMTGGTFIAGNPPGSAQTSTASNSVGNQKVVASSGNIGSTGTVSTPANLSSVSPIIPGGFA